MCEKNRKLFFIQQLLTLQEFTKRTKLPHENNSTRAKNQLISFT